MRLENGAARAVHGDTIEFRVDGGQEAGDFDARLLAEPMQCPCTVFAAAPGDENSFHGVQDDISTTRCIDSKTLSIDHKARFLCHLVVKLHCSLVGLMREPINPAATRKL